MDKQNACPSFLQEVDMDKISGIIPSSARVSSVDLKESSPVRPGTPNFGRPEGNSSLKGASTAERAAATAAQLEAPVKAPSMQKEATDWRTKDTMQAKLVNEVSNNFFMKNTSQAEAPSRGSTAFPSNPNSMKALSFSDPSNLAGFKDEEIGSFQAPSLGGHAMAEDEEGQVTLKQPEGLYPRGSFIDRTA
jgi:hypothetical protein